jgi:hypothetical protein
VVTGADFRAFDRRCDVIQTSPRRHVAAGASGVETKYVRRQIG